MAGCLFCPRFQPQQRERSRSSSRRGRNSIVSVRSDITPLCPEELHSTHSNTHHPTEPSLVVHQGSFGYWQAPWRQSSGIKGHKERHSVASIEMVENEMPRRSSVVSGDDSRKGKELLGIPALRSSRSGSLAGTAMSMLLADHDSDAPREMEPLPSYELPDIEADNLSLWHGILPSVDQLISQSASRRGSMAAGAGRVLDEEHLGGLKILAEKLQAEGVQFGVPIKGDGGPGGLREPQMTASVTSPKGPKLMKSFGL
ncbi:unnamed protein product [Vitrella brassicaformis CCMP3155]|uniref:Uncharacterized protein n=1 Tax=Vitrella brassicaformis (strain CCMP3155) TaxID=1169540 RepID=A0A0G4G712_VITBC|nr:unnamed protein product [Vitrella brassicaformis CCMP3155]|eukprot:CEM24457.1 unnamed protein product [Vitrella brassicaformis CCMP3155]